MASKLTSKITVHNEHGADEQITVAEAILRALRLGVRQKYAAQAAGVHEVTLSNWIGRGREWAEDPAKAPARDRPFAKFANEVVRAKASAVAFYEGVLHTEASKGSVRAAEAWLRANVPEYREKVSVEHGGQVSIEVSDKLDREIAELMDELAPSGEAPTADTPSG